MPSVTQLFIAQDDAAFAKKAAQLIVEITAEAVDQRKKASWALCGGRTPKLVFPLLAEPYFRDRIDWKSVDVYWGDERCVPPDHADSNYKLAMDALLSKVPLPEKNIHRIPGEMATALEAARAYDQMLHVNFKFERPFPKFDLMLLGMGEDGHTASLFPKADALQENEKWAVGYRVERLASNRVSLTFPVINHARRIIIMTPGENKANVLRDLFRRETPENRYPVQKVKPVDGELIWLLDKLAASKLPADVQLNAKNI